jgi:hypothetical protein
MMYNVYNGSLHDGLRFAVQYYYPELIKPIVFLEWAFWLWI